MKIPVTRSLTVALLAALTAATLVILVVWLVGLESGTLTEAADHVTQARGALAALDGFTADLAEADTRRCAYVTRAEPLQLEAFHAAADAARTKLGRFGELVAAEAGLSGQVEGVVGLAGRKLAVLESSLALRARGRLNDRGQLALTRQSQELAEELNATVGRLRAEVDAVLDRRTRQAGAAARNAGMIAGVGNLLALACVGLAAVAVGRELVARGNSRVAAPAADRPAREQAAEESARGAEARAKLEQLELLRRQTE
jgi:CHASE3 domain sensor protein